MPQEKTKYRLVENIGEIWLTEDGTYSYRMFDFPITGNGLDTAYRAECDLERRAATEYARRAGQLGGYERQLECKPWYGIAAASYLTGAWDKSKTRRAIDRAMRARR